MRIKANHLELKGPYDERPSKISTALLQQCRDAMELSQQEGDI